MFLLVIILLILGFVIFVSYNSIVIKRNAVENAYSSLDAILKKRFDILPNIVASVQQAMSFEGGTLEKIVSLRNATSNTTLESEERIQKENELTSLMSKVLMTVENYPELKSNTNIMHLQRTIIELEEDIAYSRKIYNTSVLAYNNQIETMPSNWVAKEMGATRKSYFEAVTSERENVSVKDLFKEK
jgi:LemA protein